MATCTSSAAACSDEKPPGAGKPCGDVAPGLSCRHDAQHRQRPVEGVHGEPVGGGVRREPPKCGRVEPHPRGEHELGKPGDHDQRSDRCGCGKGRHQQRARRDCRERQRKPVEQLSEIEQISRSGQHLRSPLVAARHALAAATIAASALASRTMRGRTIRTVSTAASTVEQTRVLKAHVATAAALRE